MAFRFGIPNIAFRRRMSWTDFILSITVGIAAGIYTFQPGLKDARAAIERREALKEIQARRKAELSTGFTPIQSIHCLSIMRNILFRIELVSQRLIDVYSCVSICSHLSS
jgi:hypothetical protein